MKTWIDNSLQLRRQMVANIAAEKNIEAINAEYEYEAQQQKIIDEYLKKYE